MTAVTVPLPVPHVGHDITPVVVSGVGVTTIGRVAVMLVTVPVLSSTHDGTPLEFSCRILVPELLPAKHTQCVAFQ